MDRRVLLQFAAVALASPSVVFAQAEKRYRVGWLTAAKASDATTPFYRRIRAEFLTAMAERGYVEGKNFVFDVRYAEGDATRFPAMAEELIALKPDALIGVQTMALAMIAKTKTIPIVMNTSIDPVGAGLVKIARKAARSKRLTLTVATAANANEIKRAFDEFEKRRIDIVVISTAATLLAQRNEIINEARRMRLPTVFGVATYAESGGLLSYGPDIVGNFRVVAELIDQIFKGAKPADLPLRQTAKFELVVNLKAAREIDITVPQSLLFRADRVIE